MRRLAILILILSGLVGCKPTEKVEEVSTTVIPYELRADVNSGMMVLSWKLRGQALLSGYNIYLTDYSLADAYPDGDYPESVKPVNLTVYPGDTNPDDGIVHYEALGLTNGQRYYATVRAVYPDRAMSRPSNEIQAVPGPRGTIALGLRYQGDHDGYSFAGEKYVQADNVANDLYFFFKDGEDILASPNRLDGFLRESKLWLLPFKGEAAEVMARVATADLPKANDKIAVRKNDWVLLRTADNHHVLLNVKGITGQGKGRVMTLYFAVSMLDGDMFF